MVRRGSEFQQLLVDHIPQLRRYAYGLTGQRDSGDDLVQETLERAWDRRSSFDPSRPMRPWLLTILHNLHANQVRYQSRRPTVALEAVEEPHAVSGPGAVEMAELTRALARLSAQHREVLLLVGVEQLSYQEAADVLGVPVGTVMSRLARSRERLRSAMAAPRLERVK
jgi:RNA polymerase sigma-70 factor (ECF subfamily)